MMDNYNHLIELKYMAKEIVNLVEDSCISEESKVLIIHRNIEVMHKFSDMMRYETAKNNVKVKETASLLILKEQTIKFK